MALTEWSDSDWPQFIIGGTESRDFVVHLHHPRFIGEVCENIDLSQSIKPTFIDSVDSVDAPTMARLMREAGDYYAQELSRDLDELE